MLKSTYFCINITRLNRIFTYTVARMNLMKSKSSEKRSQYKRALRPGTPWLDIRRLHTERAKYIFPNGLSTVCMSIDYVKLRSFFFSFFPRSGFPRFVKLAALEIPIPYDGFTQTLYGFPFKA